MELGKGRQHIVGMGLGEKFTKGKGKDAGNPARDTVAFGANGAKKGQWEHGGV
jgi:hypothetical protein